MQPHSGKLLAHLEEQFLRAAQTYPRLHFAATKPLYPEGGRWPLPDMLELFEWWELFGLGRNGGVFLDARCFVRVDGQLWEVACYDGQQARLVPQAELPAMQRELNIAVGTLEDLATQAAAILPPTETQPFDPPLQEKPAHRWYEWLFSRDWISEKRPRGRNGEFLLRLLPNVFMASAQAVQEFAVSSITQTSEAHANRGNTANSPTVATMGDLLRVNERVVTLPKMANYEAFDRILAHCRRMWGGTLGQADVIHRAAGTVATYHRLRNYQVDELPLPEFVALFEQAIDWQQPTMVPQADATLSALPPAESEEAREAGLPLSADTTKKADGISGGGSTQSGAEKGQRKSSRKGIGGKKRITGKEAKRRNDILAAWEQAKGTGIQMKTFCREHEPPLSPKELGRIVSWKAMRDRRNA